LAGALAGTAIGDTETYGLDAAVPAAFLALLWPRLTRVMERSTAGVAACVALVLVPFTRPGLPIIAAAGVAMVVAALTTDDTRASSRGAAPNDDAAR
jgi:predicted branched-subunit amino acid permease